MPISRFIAAIPFAVALGALSFSAAQETAADSPDSPPSQEEMQERKEAFLAELKAALVDVEENGETFEKLERIGDMYLQLGDPQRAVMVFERAIKNYGGTEDLFFKFARVLLLSGRPELGMKVLALGLEAHPESAKLQFELGKAYNSFGKTYAAISAFSRAIELDPKEVSYRYFLADTYRSQKKWDKAMEIVDAMVEEGTDFLPAHLMKGDLMLALGDPRGSVRFLEDVYEENPNSADAKKVLIHAYQTYAYSEASSGRLSRAIKTLEDALEVDPDNAESRASIGTFHYEAGDHQKAEEIFKEVLDRHPDYLESYALYGSLLRFLDRKEEAIAMFEAGLAKSRELGSEPFVKQYQDLLGSIRG